MDINLSKLWEILENRGLLSMGVAKSWKCPATEQQKQQLNNNLVLQSLISFFANSNICAISGSLSIYLGLSLLWVMVFCLSPCRIIFDWMPDTVIFTLFSSVQLFSCVQLFSTPWVASHQASLSITNSQGLLKFMSIELVMPSSHLILCHPLLLLLPIPPSIRVFSNESTLHMRWPKY